MKLSLIKIHVYKNNIYAEVLKSFRSYTLPTIIILFLEVDLAANLSVHGHTLLHQ